MKAAVEKDVNLPDGGKNFLPSPNVTAGSSPAPTPAINSGTKPNFPAVKGGENFPLRSGV